MKRRSYVSLVISLFILSFAFAFVAFGSEEEAAHAPWWKDYIWKVINFGVLIIILVKFGKKPIQAMLKQRTEMIEKTLKEAKQAKANIAFELKYAKEAIKAEAAEIAIEMAEKKLKEKLTTEEQEKLLEESIAKIGGSN